MNEKAIDKTAIRDAATVILVRETSDGPAILMGQRGAKAAFMPNKFVFPGGAVDAEDRFASGISLDAVLAEKLGAEAEADMPVALVHAAVREVWEETGLVIGQTGAAPAQVPANWREFYESGFAPSCAGMRMIFRAVTPPGRPRRFDARFLMVESSCVNSDLDDFSKASGELSHLQWVLLSEAQKFELAFITEIVLAELEAILSNPGEARPIPFFSNATDPPEFSVL